MNGACMNFIAFFFPLFVHSEKLKKNTMNLTSQKARYPPNALK